MVADSLEPKAKKSDSTEKKNTKLQKRENIKVTHEHYLELHLL